MIGFKKSSAAEEVVEETEERPEVATRQRVRRRTNTGTATKTEENVGFSFGRVQLEEETTEEPVEAAEEPEQESKEELVEESVKPEPKPVEAPVKPEPKPVEASKELVGKSKPEPVKREAQKTLDRILSGGEMTRRDSLLRKVQNTIAVYNSRNSGVTSEDVQVRYYHDEMNEVTTTEDGRLLLPNQRVYYRGFVEEWDRVNEVRVPNGAEFELDLGIGIFLPDGYELELAGVRELRTKYELELIDGVVHLSRQNAMFPIVLQMRAVGDMAYVQKHKSLIQARLVRV